MTVSIALGSAAWQDEPVVSTPDDDALLGAAGFVHQILSLENGYVDVAALDLPDAYVRRIADRAFRMAVRGKLRRFVKNRPAVADPSPCRAAPE